MNRKFIGILAASAAFLGSAIVAAPAKATEAEVGVNITVQPAMFLRTFSTLELNISQGELGGTDKGPNIVPVSDGNTAIDRTAPESFGGGTSGTVIKPVKEIFALWGNSGNKATVNVTVAPQGDVLTRVGTGTGVKPTAKMTALATNNTKTFDDSGEPLVGGADLTFTFSGTRGASAGRYEGGKLLVRAVATP
jgi:hypothetical protein